MTMVFALLFLGFGLVVAEVFFPSLGALSILAGLTLIGAVVSGFDYSMTLGWTSLVIVLIGLPFVVVFAFRIFPRTPMGKKMISPGASWSKQERAAVDHEVERFVGSVGLTSSLLRPSGIAIFDGERVDVITSGEHIEAGIRVHATSFESNRLVVETAATEK